MPATLEPVAASMGSRHQLSQGSVDVEAVDRRSHAARPLSSSKAPACTGPSYGRSSDSPDEFVPPRCVGRYRMLEKLGAGGMGVVYRAYDPPVELQLRWLDANASANRGARGVEANLEFQRRAIDLATRHLGRDHLRTTMLINNHSVGNARAGNIEIARSLAREAKERFVAILGPLHPDVLLATTNYALYSGNAGDFMTAEREIDRALGIAKALGRLDHPSTLHTWVSLGSIREELGRKVSATAAHRKALELMRLSGVSDGPYPQMLRLGLAALEFELGHESPARNLWRKLRPTLERTDINGGNGEAPGVLWRAANLAVSLGDCAFVEQVVATLQHLPSPTANRGHQSAAGHETLRARCFESGGQLSRAAHHYNLALEHQIRVAGENNLTTSPIRMHILAIELQQGAYQNARRSLDELARILDRTVPPYHRLYARWYIEAARLALRLDDIQSARIYRRDAHTAYDAREQGPRLAEELTQLDALIEPFGLGPWNAAASI